MEVPNVRPNSNTNSPPMPKVNSTTNKIVKVAVAALVALGNFLLLPFESAIVASIVTTALIYWIGSLFDGIAEGGSREKVGSSYRSPVYPLRYSPHTPIHVLSDVRSSSSTPRYPNNPSHRVVVQPDPTVREPVGLTPTRSYIPVLSVPPASKSGSPPQSRQHDNTSWRIGGQSNFVNREFVGAMHRRTPEGVPFQHEIVGKKI